MVAKVSNQDQESTVICYLAFWYYCCHCYSTPLVCSAVNNLPMGYPVLQQPPYPAAGQPHLDPMGCGMSSCHVVNGVPAPSNFHPIRMNSGNEWELLELHVIYPWLPIQLTVFIVVGPCISIYLYSLWILLHHIFKISNGLTNKLLVPYVCNDVFACVCF